MVVCHVDVVAVSDLADPKIKARFRFRMALPATMTTTGQCHDWYLFFDRPKQRYTQWGFEGS